MKFPSHIRLTGLPYETFFEVGMVDGRLRVTGGMHQQLISLYRSALHFDYTCELPRDEVNYGTPDARGVWSGLFGMLQRNESDMIACTILVTKNRTEVADFSFPYRHETFTFASQALDPESKLSSVLMPFDGITWVAMVITIAAMSVVFAMLLPKERLSQGALRAYGAVVMQGFDLKSSRLSDRLLVGLYVLGAMLLAYSYNVVLLSFLSMPPKDKVIDTTDQLSRELDRGRFKAYVLQSSTDLKSWPRASVQNIVRHIKKNNWQIPVTLKDIGTTLSAKNVALFGMGGVFKSQAVRRLHVASDSLGLILVAIPISKHFCCKDAFDEAILRLSSAGLIQKVVEDHSWKVRTKGLLSAPSEDEEPIKPLSLSDLSGSFLILGFGLTVSCFVFTAEVLRGRLCRKSKPRTVKSRRVFSHQLVNEYVKENASVSPKPARKRPKKRERITVKSEVET